MFRYLMLFVLSVSWFAHAGHHEPHNHSNPIMVSDIWIKAPLPGSTATAAYLVINNHGTVDDKLVGVDSGFAKINEIHEMKMDNGVMRMRQVEAGVPIPAGEQVNLGPGGSGLHIMLYNLIQELNPGQTYDIQLEFEVVGSITVPAKVKKNKGDSNEHQHHH